MRGGTALRLFYLLVYGARAAWIPVRNVYLQQAGLSGLQIGALSGIEPAVSLLSQPVWGVAADTWGRRRTLLWAVPLAGLLLLGYLWNGGFWYFAVCIAAFTLLANPIGPLMDSLALDYLERFPALSFGQLRVWGAVGWSLVALLSGRALAGRDMRLAFVMAAAAMLLSWAVLRQGVTGAQGSGSMRRSWRGVGSLLRRRGLLIFLGLTLLLQVGVAPINTFYAIYMKELGASSQMVGLAYALRALSEIPVYAGAAVLIRRLQPGKTLAIAFLVYALQAFLYSIIHTPLMGALAELLHGPSFGLIVVAAVDYVNRQVPGEWRATGQTLYAAASSGAGAIVGSVWAGLLYDAVGMRPMFRLNAWLIAGVAVIAALALRGSSGEAEPSCS